MIIKVQKKKAENWILVDLAQYHWALALREDSPIGMAITYKYIFYSILDVNKHAPYIIVWKKRAFISPTNEFR